MSRRSIPTLATGRSKRSRWRRIETLLLVAFAAAIAAVFTKRQTALAPGPSSHDDARRFSGNTPEAGVSKDESTPLTDEERRAMAQRTGATSGSSAGATTAEASRPGAATEEAIAPDLTSEGFDVSSGAGAPATTESEERESTQTGMEIEEATEQAPAGERTRPDTTSEGMDQSRGQRAAGGQAATGQAAGGEEMENIVDFSGAARRGEDAADVTPPEQPASEAEEPELSPLQTAGPNGNQGSGTTAGATGGATGTGGASGGDVATGTSSAETPAPLSATGTTEAPVDRVVTGEVEQPLPTDRPAGLDAPTDDDTARQAIELVGGPSEATGSVDVNREVDVLTSAETGSGQDRGGEVAEAETHETGEVTPAGEIDPHGVRIPASADAFAPSTADVAPQAERAGFVRLAKGEHNCPDGYPIKGNASSRIYHLPGESSYDATIPEICFASAEEAAKAGFRPRRR